MKESFIFSISKKFIKQQLPLQREKKEKNKFIFVIFAILNKLK